MKIQLLISAFVLTLISIPSAQACPPKNADREHAFEEGLSKLKLDAATKASVDKLNEAAKADIERLEAESKKLRDESHDLMTKTPIDKAAVLASMEKAHVSFMQLRKATVGLHVDILNLLKPADRDTMISEMHDGKGKKMKCKHCDKK